MASGLKPNSKRPTQDEALYHHTSKVQIRPVEVRRGEDTAAVKLTSPFTEAASIHQLQRQPSRKALSVKELLNSDNNSKDNLDQSQHRAPRESNGTKTNRTSNGCIENFVFAIETTRVHLPSFDRVKIIKAILQVEATTLWWEEYAVSHILNFARSLSALSGSLSRNGGDQRLVRACSITFAQLSSILISNGYCTPKEVNHLMASSQRQGQRARQRSVWMAELVRSLEPTWGDFATDIALLHDVPSRICSVPAGDVARHIDKDVRKGQEELLNTYPFSVPALLLTAVPKLQINDVLYGRKYDRVQLQSTLKMYQRWRDDLRDSTVVLTISPTIFSTKYHQTKKHNWIPLVLG